MVPQVAEKLVGIPSPPSLILPFLLLYHLFRRWRKSWWKLWESGRRSVDVFRQLTGQSAEQIATLQAAIGTDSSGSLKEHLELQKSPGIMV